MTLTLQFFCFQMRLACGHLEEVSEDRHLSVVDADAGPHRRRVAKGNGIRNARWKRNLVEHIPKNYSNHAKINHYSTLYHDTYFINIEDKITIVSPVLVWRLPADTHRENRRPRQGVIRRWDEWRRGGPSCGATPWWSRPRGGRAPRPGRHLPWGFPLQLPSCY